ncbi:MAG: hypothetical protein IK079_00030 [Desulfovibrio sp.]|nr:hypothetical protein [Desulfovibrio sp.]
MIKKPARVCDIVQGQDSRFDAWLYSMLMDNNLTHALNPHLIASQEQLAFMVYLQENHVYLPCSDATFALLGGDTRNSALQQKYNRIWKIIAHIVRTTIKDREAQKRIFQFCLYRYKQYTSHQTILPSRLLKRLINLVLKQSEIMEDPWVQKRRTLIQKHKNLFENPIIQKALHSVTAASLPDNMLKIREKLNALEMLRLLYLNLYAKTWEDHLPDAATIAQGFCDAEKQAPSIITSLTERHEQATVLYLCDTEGSVFFDLAVIKALINMGHRVIYAVKDTFFFNAPTIYDMTEEPLMEELPKNVRILRDLNVSKNVLLKELQAHPFMIINDGTSEHMNLYRVSLTFARAWKESDVVVANGWRAKDIFLDTSHSFTRDIILSWIDDQGFHIKNREHAPLAHKFSAFCINEQADRIIKSMREAHKQHKSVMFFSCIIGSIPGQTQLAITLATKFVEHLRNHLENVLIINPAEHFIPGMDGDDLMYMWERVQRSGQIDIWRFQTSQDIESSFALLKQKVPQIWSGKDATYSTGCTKEMRIALEVQQKNKEMQIIGPDPKLFFRRSEYGVGKYFDANYK